MHKREIVSVVGLGISILVFLSLVSFSPADLSFLQTPTNHPPQNLIGIVGAWLGFLLFSFFGITSYLLVFLGFGLALLHFYPLYETYMRPRIIGCIVLVLSSAVLLSPR